MDHWKHLVGRALDSLLPPPDGVRQQFESTREEFWTTTEIDLVGCRAEQVVAKLLEPWDGWWAHSRASGSSREGEGPCGQLRMACFEPLVLQAQSLQRARQGVEDALDRLPMLRAMVRPKLSEWITRMVDDGGDLSAARLQIEIGPATSTSERSWQLPAKLEGDFCGSLSFDVVGFGDNGVTLREHFGDPSNRAPGYGVRAGGRVKNPLAAAMLHLCAVGARFPGLDAMGYVGLRHKLPADDAE